MSLKPKYFASALLIASGAVASIAGSTTAAADPAFPVAGNNPADVTIQELVARGYDVAINWVRGYSTVPLSRCTVDAIHNPDGPPGSQRTPTTVYVDVSCPNDWN
jgi:hypothetical protein